MQILAGATQGGAEQPITRAIPLHTGGLVTDELIVLIHGPEHDRRQGVSTFAGGKSLRLIEDRWNIALGGSVGLDGKVLFERTSGCDTQVLTQQVIDLRAVLKIVAVTY
jgi:hypothetical protein